MPAPAPKYSIPIFSNSHGCIITCLHISKEHIVTASDTGAIAAHAIDTGELLHSFEGHRGGVWSLAVSGNTIVSGSTDKTARVWDIDTGKCNHVFGGHTGTVRSLVLLKPQWVKLGDDNGVVTKEKWPKRSLIVTGSRDASLHVWTLPRPSEPLYDCFEGFSQEEIKNGTVNVSENPYHREYLKGHRSSVRCVAGRGRTVISASFDNELRVWDVITGECKWVLAGHSQKVYNVVYDHEREQAFSGSMDGNIRLWDLNSGECKRVMTGHTSLIGLLSLTPSYLVSGAADGTVRIWDRATGEWRDSHITPDLAVVRCFGCDDAKVVSGTSQVTMWNLKDSTVTDIPMSEDDIYQIKMLGKWCVVGVQVQKGVKLLVWDFSGNPEWVVGDVDEVEEVISDDEAL